MHLAVRIFAKFKYARAVKQKLWNEAENRERDWGETLKRRACEALSFRARKTLTPRFTDSFTILRNIPTVLQSTPLSKLRRVKLIELGRCCLVSVFVSSRNALCWRGALRDETKAAAWESSYYQDIWKLVCFNGSQSRINS